MLVCFLRAPVECLRELAAWQGQVTTVRKDCPSHEAKRRSQMASREGTAHVNGRPQQQGIFQKPRKMSQKTISKP